IILQTGCLHGNVYPVSLSHAAPRQTYQYISAYVNAVREEAKKTGAEVVLFDSGNSLCGSFASEILDSENVATFFNKVGYDAIILGNQDVQLPMRSLSAVRVPMLNPFRLEHSDYPPAARHDSIVLKKGRLEIRLFAVFCPDQSSTWPLTSANIPPGVAAAGLPVIDHTGHALNVCAALNGDFFRRRDLVDILAQTGADVLSGEAAGFRRDPDPPRDPAHPDVVLSQNFFSERGEDYVARIDLRRTAKGWRADRQELIRMCGEVVHADKGVVEELLPLSQRLARLNRLVVTLNQPMDQSAIREIIGRALDGIQPGAGWILPKGDQGAVWEAGPLYLSDIFDVIPWDDELVVLTGLRPSFSELSQYYWIRPVGEANALITLRSIGVRLSRGQVVDGVSVRTRDTGKKVYEAVATLLSD
ncbi:MAG TPA: hypothetical protein VI756_30245, partial [Blastocatellia bacterium]